VLTVSFIVCLQQFTKDDRSIIFEFTICTAVFDFRSDAAGGRNRLAYLLQKSGNFWLWEFT